MGDRVYKTFLSFNDDWQFLKEGRAKVDPEAWANPEAQANILAEFEFAFNINGATKYILVENTEDGSPVWRDVQ